MAIGTVKWFNSEKGYGFVQPEDGGKDVFVHSSELKKSGISTLHENQQVSYDLSDNNGKVFAVNLKTLD